MVRADQVNRPFPGTQQGLLLLHSVPEGAKTGTGMEDKVAWDTSDLQRGVVGVEVEMTWKLIWVPLIEC